MGRRDDGTIDKGNIPKSDRVTTNRAIDGQRNITIETKCERKISHGRVRGLDSQRNDPCRAVCLDLEPHLPSYTPRDTPDIQIRE